MSATCPIHGAPLQRSPRRNGRLFCPKKDDDGRWCKYEIRDGGAETTEASAAPTPRRLLPRDPTTSPSPGVAVLEQILAVLEQILGELREVRARQDAHTERQEAF